MSVPNGSDQLFPCPCCGFETISEIGTYEICEVCNWEDDPIQSANPDYRGGANEESLSEAQLRWQHQKAPKTS